MHWLKKVAFAVGYTFVYLLFAALSLGAGHGSYVALVPLIPWFLIFVALYFVGSLDSQLNRILFVMVMVAHYLLLAILVWEFLVTDEYLSKYWSWILPATWYLIGQIALWMMLISERSIKKSEADL